MLGLDLLENLVADGLVGILVDVDFVEDGIDFRVGVLVDEGGQEGENVEVFGFPLAIHLKVFFVNFPPLFVGESAPFLIDFGKHSIYIMRI